MNRKQKQELKYFLRKEIAGLEDAESQSSEIPFGMDINDARMLQAYRIAQAALQTKPLNNIHEKYDYFTDTACLLTSEEQKIAQLLGDAWNLYLTLPVEHPMGRDEFCRAIHHCQNMVLARPAIRALARKGKAIKISKTPSSRAFISMHNSAQICTILLNDFLPFRPAWRLDPSGSVRAQKNALFCAQVTGNSPRFRGK